MAAGLALFGHFRWTLKSGYNWGTSERYGQSANAKPDSGGHFTRHSPAICVAFHVLRSLTVPSVAL